MIGITMGLSLSAQYYFNPSYVNVDKYKVLDSAYLKITYKLTFVKDTLKTQQTSNDMQVLLIGTKISKYYSQDMLDHCKYASDLEKKGAEGIPWPKEGVNSYEIFKNYPDGQTTVTDLATPLQANYIYEDDLKNIKWNITKEKATILSYSCQKATAKFRGRTYEAWFTTDIPVNNGPWKFGGLPGLIMRVSDSQKHFAFECIGLERLKKKEPIKYFSLDYTKITRRNLDKLYRRLHDDYAAYNASLGITTREVDPKTGKTMRVKNSAHKYPFNPIERE